MYLQHGRSKCPLRECLCIFSSLICNSEWIDAYFASVKFISWLLHKRMFVISCSHFYHHSFMPDDFFFMHPIFHHSTHHINIKLSTQLYISSTILKFIKGMSLFWFLVQRRKMLAFAELFFKTALSHSLMESLSWQGRCHCFCHFLYVIHCKQSTLDYSVDYLIQRSIYRSSRLWVRAKRCKRNETQTAIAVIQSKKWHFLIHCTCLSSTYPSDSYYIKLWNNTTIKSK